MYIVIMYTIINFLTVLTTDSNRINCMKKLNLLHFFIIITLYSFSCYGMSADTETENPQYYVLLKKELLKKFNKKPIIQAIIIDYLKEIIALPDYIKKTIVTPFMNTPHFSPACFGNESLRSFYPAPSPNVFLAIYNGHQNNDPFCACLGCPYGQSLVKNSK